MTAASTSIAKLINATRSIVESIPTAKNSKFAQTENVMMFSAQLMKIVKKIQNLESFLGSGFI